MGNKKHSQASLFHST